MAILGWGKPTIYVKDLDATSAPWVALPTPVENSTKLNTTKGDKQEAKIEGGENEDVRYASNTYMLECEVRAAKGRPKPIADTDGRVAHQYAVAVQPEDKDCQGIYIAKATVSVEDVFDTEDGGSWIYNFDALKSGTTSQIQWGKIKTTGEGASLQVSVEPVTAAGGETE